MAHYVFSGESADSAHQRQALLAAEQRLRVPVERVAQRRRARPFGRTMPDYVFREGPADLRHTDPAAFRDVRLSELCDHGHDELIVAHLMFAPHDEVPCVMGSMWADGYNAIAPHIRQRANFVVVAKQELGARRDGARRRGGDRLRLLSSHDTTFNRDVGAEHADGAQNSGLSVFTRAASGAIHHRYTIGDELPQDAPGLYQGDGRGIDPYSPVWALFDLLPSGRGDWRPSHAYLMPPKGTAATGGEAARVPRGPESNHAASEARP